MKLLKFPLLGIMSAVLLMGAVALAQSGPAVILRCEEVQGKSQSGMVDFVRIEKGQTVGYKRDRNSEMPKAVVTSSGKCSVYPVTDYQQQ